jgi:hypothetical protein
MRLNATMIFDGVAEILEEYVDERKRALQE